MTQDYSNKDTRAHLHVYPEVTEDGSISEVFHAGKFHGPNGYDLSDLSPMWDAGGGVHYYVNELAQCLNGQYVIPIRWITFRGEVYADAHQVTLNTCVCFPGAMPNLWVCCAD